MTSLLRRVGRHVRRARRQRSVVGTLIAPRHHRRSGTARRGRVAAATGGRLHAATPRARRPGLRTGRCAATPDAGGHATTPHGRPRRHPGIADAPHASWPDGIRIGRRGRPADATRPSGDHRRDRARGRRRGDPGRGCVRRRVARPGTRRRRTPLRVASDRRADGRPPAGLGRRRRRSPAVDAPRARRRLRVAGSPVASKQTGSRRRRVVGSPGSGASRSRRTPPPRPAAASPIAEAPVVIAVAGPRARRSSR